MTKKIIIEIQLSMYEYAQVVFTREKDKTKLEAIASTDGGDVIDKQTYTYDKNMDILVESLNNIKIDENEEDTMMAYWTWGIYDDKDHLLKGIYGGYWSYDMWLDVIETVNSFAGDENATKWLVNIMDTQNPLHQ